MRSLSARQHCPGAHQAQWRGIRPPVSYLRPADRQPVVRRGVRESARKRFSRQTGDSAKVVRILIIGNSDKWRMEKSVERAFKRAGHKTRLIDDMRTKRLMGRKLTQRLVAAQARRFKPDFILLSTCLGLDLNTVRTILGDTPNAMWYHNPQWYRATYRPDIKHIMEVGKLSQTFFVTGFDAEWRALGLRAKFLPAAADRDIRPVPYNAKYHSDVSFIGT